jgi:putative ABC transport system permease protein
VVLGPELLAAAGVDSGSTVAVGSRSLQVVASATDGSFNHLPVAWVSLPDWQRLAGGKASDATVVALETGTGVDLAAGDAAAGTTTTSRTGAFAAIGSYTAENGSLTLIRVLLFAVGALVVGAFFTVWTIQRTPDLAVLKAIGATSRYLVKDSLAQAGAVLVIGGSAGALLATGLGLLASSAVPFIVSPATTVFPLTVTLAVGLVGALAAVRSIVKVDPLTALGAAR